MGININKINDIIAEFCHNTINEPLTFFSESDLQALLFSQLILKGFLNLVKTNCRRGGANKDNLKSNGYYKTYQVHKEYGLNQSPNARIDIAIFEKAELAKIDNPNLKLKNKYIVPHIGIELGTHKTSKHKSHIENDIKKIKYNNIKYGYLIYIIKDETFSFINSKQGIKTRNKLSEIKNIFNKIYYQVEVKPLIFILKVTKQQKKIWGKCEFYFGNDQWKPIGLKDIKNKVKNYLMLKTHEQPSQPNI